MSLLATRAAIAAHVHEALKKHLPATLTTRLNTDTHGGSFDAQALNRLAVAAPAVRVALLGAGNLASRGSEVSCEAVFGVFLITAGGQKGEPRDMVALAFLPAILATIANNRWGLESSESNPASAKADNLFSAQLDSRHVALWAVSFRQRVTLSGGMEAALLAVTEAELAAALNNAESADGKDTPCPQAAQPIPPGGHCPTCSGTEHTGHKPVPGTGNVNGIDDFLRAGLADAPQQNPDKGLFPVRPKQGN